MNYSVFGDSIDGATHAQMAQAMSAPFVLKGALMPDAHLGYSLPIGGVVLTKPGYVVPSFVGYDIGCGMTAAPLLMKEPTREQLEVIRDKILEQIPVGNNKRKDTGKYTIDTGFTELGRKIALTRGAGQLGTLGGGNHFIEIGKDERGLVWICIHSGSRGVGHAIGTHYMKVAAAKAGITTGNFEGHYPLTSDMPEYYDYMKDMDAALAWSTLNRETMFREILEIIREVMPWESQLASDPITNNHNMAEAISSGNIHRKGATPAGRGQKGIIPGNMRDGFFVVEGKGNFESLNSASHGAGRVMSRGEAKAKVDFEEFKAQMADVVTNITTATIDEAPAAYKSIYEVMDSQSSCVSISHHVTPLLNVKG